MDLVAATQPAPGAERRKQPRWRSPHRIVALANGAQRSPQGRPELRIMEQIGSGGMGTVHRARQTALDRDVALKRLTNTDEASRRYFVSEACITAALDHPNIAPVHDLGVDGDGTLFYTMKLVAGTAWATLLERRLHERYDDPRRHIDVLLEVVNAAAFAHSRGFIHRDLKPPNVVVGDFGEVIVVDWGLAVSLKPIRGDSRILHLGEAAIACGTPAYMPPEVAREQRAWIGPWSDVYMLGAMLFEILYGTAPLEARSAQASLQLSSQNSWSFPPDLVPRLLPLHRVLSSVICRAMATDPRTRYPNAAALGKAIRAALAALEPTEDLEPTRSRRPPPRTLHVVCLVVAYAVATLLIAALVVQL